MNTKFLKNILNLLVISSFFSCSLDVPQNCTFQFNTRAIEAEGEDEILLGQNIDIDVTFFRASACYEFKRFDETQINANVRGIKIVISNPECNCDDVPVTGIIRYTYTPTSPGEYTFRFNTSETEYISKTVTVLD
jgi:hypothetical protein